MSANKPLVLINQFGEESINTVEGTYLPLPGAGNVVLWQAAGAPTNGGSGTGHGIAGKGSLYIDSTNAVLYQNTNTLASPTWTVFEEGNASVIAAVLTGFAAGAGTVSSTDSILTAFNKVIGNQANLQNGTPTPQTEAIIGAGALSTTKMESTVSNVTVGTYAATLAAPSSQDGQLKVVKAIATMSHTVTLAMTNILMSAGYTPTGTTTLTFTNAGDSAIFMALGVKWIYLGGSAVAS